MTGQFAPAGLNGSISPEAGTGLLLLESTLDRVVVSLLSSPPQPANSASSATATSAAKPGPSQRRLPFPTAGLPLLELFIAFLLTPTTAPHAPQCRDIKCLKAQHAR